MPIVQIDFKEGRPLETKRKLVKELTDVFVNTMNVKADNVQIIIHEFTAENYSRGGVLNVDKK